MKRWGAIVALLDIAESGSFREAARRGRVSQSTISKWIAELEAELGAALLARTTRHVALTPDGEAFVPRARALLAMWDEARGAIGRPGRPLDGILRASVPSVFGAKFIAPLIPAWLEAHPGLEVELRFDDRYVDLVAERVDVAIRVGRAVDSSYVARLVARGERRLVAAPSYLEGAPPLRTPADLERHRCLTHEGHARGGTVWTLQRAGERAEVRVGGPLRANQSDVLRRCAEADHGVAMLAEWSVRDALESGSLVEPLPGWSGGEAPVRALLSAGRLAPERATRFVAFLKTSLRASIEPPGRAIALDRSYPELIVEP